VSEPLGGHDLGWRVSVIEKRLDRLEAGKPDVIADRVERLSRDVQLMTEGFGERTDALSDKVDSLRRVFMGLLVTIAGACVLIVIAQVLLAGARP
jgi:hypothetical protein